MDPQRSAFLSAVFRFLALHFDPKRPWSREYESLSAWLRETEPQSDRLEWQSRAYRRIPMDNVPATLWNRGVAVIGEVLDLCATGMRVGQLKGHITLPEGAHTSISVRPGGSTLRIDLPCTVIRMPNTTSCCVQFRGSPLVLHTRTAPSRRKQLPLRQGSIGVVETGDQRQLRVVDNHGEEQRIDLQVAAVPIENPDLNRATG